MKILLPPKKLWLYPSKFKFNEFNKEDLYCIFTSPNDLILDFAKIEGFKQHVKMIEPRLYNKLLFLENKNKEYIKLRKKFKRKRETNKSLIDTIFTNLNFVDKRS